MTERIVADDELRQLIEEWRRQGLPAPVSLEQALPNLTPAQKLLLEKIIELAREEEDRFGNAGRPVRGSDHWQLRDQIRANLQEALVAGMIHVGLVQRLLFGYGAIPHPNQHWRFFYDHDKCWSCWTCGAEILSKIVTDSVHYAEFGGLTGGGETVRRQVSYCPICDPVPRNGSVTETIAQSLAREMS